MQPSNLCFLAAVALLLVSSFTNASPVDAQQAVRRTPAPSGAPTKFEWTPFQAREAPIASPSPSPLSTFCDAFVKQCYKIALRGQGGEVEVTHSCEQNGGSNSRSFTYSCARNGQLLTPAVLRALGGSYFVPSLTVVTLENQVTTELIEKLATAYDITTTSVTSSTAATVTSTSTTEVLDVIVESVPSTISSTTVIPYTLLSTTTATATQSTSSTATVTTATQTDVYIASGQVPVYHATVQPDNTKGKRSVPLTFCLAFGTACHNQCRKSSSRVDFEMCNSKKAPVYSMACICKNGIEQTQNALEDIAEGLWVISRTVGGSTVTTRTTSTRTTTVPTGVVTTQLLTSTLLTDTTATRQTTTTTTTGQTVEYTTVSSAVETAMNTVTTTTTSTSVTTTLVPTTTRMVLAATGYVRGFDSITGESVGALGQLEADAPMYAILYNQNSTRGHPTEMMAIRDRATGLYQMAPVGQPDWAVQTYNYSTVNPGPGSDWYAFAGILPASECGRAGISAGPIDPSASPCETFLFDPIALDPSPGSTVDTVDLRAFWINPIGSNPANATCVWAAYSAAGVTSLFQIADKEAFLKIDKPVEKFIWFSLRFPFSTP